MEPSEALKIGIDKYIEVIYNALEKVSDGSKLFIKITNSEFEAHNAIKADGLIGILLPAMISKLCAESGSLIGQLIQIADPSVVIELQFSKEDGQVKCLNSMNGDVMEQSIDDIEEHRMSKQEFETTGNPHGTFYHAAMSEEAKNKRIATILDKEELSFLKDRLDDPEFVRQIISEKNEVSPSKDLDWILNNI